MARPVSLSTLVFEAYKRSDNEGAEDRHPRADVVRYINQGRAERYDLLVEARGRSYFRKNPPQTITTVAGTTRYQLESDFYRLISVRRAGPGGYLLEPFRAEQEPELREITVREPTHYELQAGFIELLPVHADGVSVIVDYVPVIADLVENEDSEDGVNGWEEYEIAFAAHCMAEKDEEYDLIRELDKDMARMRDRISKLAPTRDMFRTERVKDVRGNGLFGRRW